jgi:hypothetical protein
MIDQAVIQVTDRNRSSWEYSLAVLTENRAYLRGHAGSRFSIFLVDRSWSITSPEDVDLLITIIDRKLIENRKRAALAAAAKKTSFSLEERDLVARRTTPTSTTARSSAGWFARLRCFIFGHRGNGRICPRCWRKVVVDG